MNLSPYVFDASAENFNHLVLENSHKGPVLAHSGRPRPGPPLHVDAAADQACYEYQGKFLLVMLNTDELGALSHRFGVTSVPTVKFFLRGEVVHTIHGADPDSSFRDNLDRFIAPDADRAHAQGLAAWRAGHLEQARMLLANAAMAYPKNSKFHAIWTKFYGPRVKPHRRSSCSTASRPKRDWRPTLRRCMRI